MSRTVVGEKEENMGEKDRGRNTPETVVAMTDEGGVHVELN